EILQGKCAGSRGRGVRNQLSQTISLAEPMITDATIDIGQLALSCLDAGLSSESVWRLNGLLRSDQWWRFAELLLNEAQLREIGRRIHHAAPDSPVSSRFHGR